ncbi:hypothetical protein ISCGN_029221 [Ixodes scapularis]
MIRPDSVWLAACNLWEPGELHHKSESDAHPALPLRWHHKEEGAAPKVNAMADILAVAATMIVVYNVKETMALSHLFVGEEEQDIPAMPCVVYSGNDAEGADFLYLAVDKQRFLSVKNAEDDITAIMVAYWLFNISTRKRQQTQLLF